MKLNHLSLPVADVERSRDFFEEYFGFKRIGGGRNMTILVDEDGLYLTLGKANGNATYPDYFHLGFIRETTEEVDELNRRLRDDGYDVPLPAKLHGNWTFYFRPPGAEFVVEVQK